MKTSLQSFVFVLLASMHSCILHVPADHSDLLLLFAFMRPKVARFVYVANNAASSSVTAYSVNSSNGSLTSVSSASSGNGAQGIVLDPQNRYAYVSASTANGVSQFTVDLGSGALTAMNPSLVGGIANPYALAVDPLGRAVYVPAGAGSTIYPFSINTNGSLSGLSTATGGVFMQGAAVDPSGKFAFFPAATGNAVFGFLINSSTGALTGTAQGSVVQTAATHVAIHPNGQFLYSLSNASGTLFIYSINQTTGALSTVTNVAGLSDCTALVITPAGDFLYVSQANPTNKISMFSVNSSTGTVSALSPASVSTNNPLGAGAIDPSGKFFYVSNFSNNTVSIFSIGASGALAAGSPATISSGSNPYGVTILSY